MLVKRKLHFTQMANQNDKNDKKMVGYSVEKIKNRYDKDFILHMNNNNNKARRIWLLESGSKNYISYQKDEFTKIESYN